MYTLNINGSFNIYQAILKKHYKPFKSFLI